MASDVRLGAGITGVDHKSLFAIKVLVHISFQASDGAVNRIAITIFQQDLRKLLDLVEQRFVIVVDCLDARLKFGRPLGDCCRRHRCIQFPFAHGMSSSMQHHSANKRAQN
jgi:hypothetical protein